ncbi:MAG: flagellar cap protein FliD N-terminal domain-containing protein, partial [Bacteroidota bacterium]|nr:flagellar cap protein FliD N-terminal domain-containing protein [Bacteroidota bacterium]
MGISSLGVGSGILTQDVLDQLREVDEAQRVTPITLEVVNENDKKNSMEVLDATMENLRDAVDELKNISAFNNREATVTGSSSVSVTAAEKSDIQDFNIHVDTLATKQIEQSGAFSSSGDSISGTDGTFRLEVGSESVDIAYTAGTTLDELNKLIQEKAGDLVDATVLKISDTDSRLVLSSKATGSTQDIKISDVTGTLDSKLTTETSFDATGTQIDPGTGSAYAAVQG